MINKIIQFFKNKYYKNAEMVKYWKTQDSVEAKVYMAPEGHYVMQMKGEKYPFPGSPRGSLLYGSLSPLKHNVKNKIFNDIWALLEEKVEEKEIMRYLRETALPEIFELAEKSKYNMVPFERMVPSVKEIYRAMTVVEKEMNNPKVSKLKELICYILQEDDAYRFRFQWACKFLRHKIPIKWWDYALGMLEHAEIVGDMKERIRLFRRITMFILKDESIKKYFELLMKEIDFKKVILTKADKYFFRAKYFKVDYPDYKY